MNECSDRHTGPLTWSLPVFICLNGRSSFWCNLWGAPTHNGSTPWPGLEPRLSANNVPALLLSDPINLLAVTETLQQQSLWIWKCPFNAIASLMVAIWSLKPAGATAYSVFHYATRRRFRDRQWLNAYKTLSITLCFLLHGIGRPTCRSQLYGMNHGP